MGCPWPKSYTFGKGQRIVKKSPSVIRRITGFLKEPRHNIDAAPLPALEEDVRYVRSALLATKMTHIYPSPSHCLENSKLSRFITSSFNIFRPPFAAWTFAALKHSKIVHCMVGFKDFPANYEGEYILTRLGGVLSHVNILAIYCVGEEHGASVLNWVNMFPQLGTLSFPDTYPLGFNHNTVKISLPSLRRLEGSTELMGMLFADEDRVHLPKLNQVVITQYGLDLTVLACSFPKTREMVSRRLSTISQQPTCKLLLALRPTKSQIAGLHLDLREGRMPKVKDIDNSEGFREVSTLKITLPAATRDDIFLGIFDPDVMAIITLFPDISSLILVPTDVHLNRPLLRSEQGQMQKFQKRCPQLSAVTIY